MSGVLHRARWRLSLVVCLLPGIQARTEGGVLINEIHYDPPEGPPLEFIELFNPVSEAVPNSCTKSDRPPATICTSSLRPNFFFALVGVGG